MEITKRPLSEYIQQWATIHTLDRLKSVEWTFKIVGWLTLTAAIIAARAKTGSYFLGAIEIICIIQIFGLADAAFDRIILFPSIRSARLSAYIELFAGGLLALTVSYLLYVTVASFGLEPLPFLADLNFT